MAEYRRPALKFTLNWKLSIASALMLAILIKLGFWQLDRAAEKRTILEEWQVQQASEAREVDSLQESLNQAYEKIAISGVLDSERYWLLENKFFNGKLGYQVLMVLQTEDNQFLLVNRGWVQGSVYREQLPTIDTSNSKLLLQGYLAVPADFKLLDNLDLTVSEWPHRVVELNIEQMSKQYGKNLYSRVLRLDDLSPAAEMINWQVINVRPQKHQAYAVQWFAMALVLAILWLLASSNIVSFFNKQITKTG